MTEQSVFLGVCFFLVAATAIGTYIFLRQDFYGKNAERLARIRKVFGERYDTRIRFGHLEVISRDAEPEDRDGLEIARILWADEDRLKKGTAIPIFQMRNSDGKIQFLIFSGQNDGRDSVWSVKPVGPWYSPRGQMSQILFLDTNEYVRAMPPN